MRLAAYLYADIVWVFQNIRYAAIRPPIGKIRVSAGMIAPKLAVGVFCRHKYSFPFQTLGNLLRPHTGGTQVEDIPHLFRCMLDNGVDLSAGLPGIPLIKQVREHG